ncbi:MAG: hypothetical protein [Bramycfau virus 6]|nr:MAG: hypothetical protein [Bramycfau virus 5]UQS94384.1 MAG: hypothetical protein [Bramycfau virus 6]
MPETTAISSDETDQQQVTFIPNTITPTLPTQFVGPSVNLPFKRIPVIGKWIIDGETQSVVKSRSVRDFLKDEIIGKGQVFLEDVRIVVKGFRSASEIGFVFHGAEEGPEDMDDMEGAINSEVFTMNGSTIGNRFVVNPVIPIGLGRRLMPPDPDLPDVHLTVMTAGGFKGRVILTFFISFSKLVLDMGDF